MLDLDKILLLWDLFKGRSDVYGTYDPNKFNDKGEIKNNRLVKKSVFPQTIQDHISGKEPFGIYPIRRKCKVKFSTIDLDIYDPLKVKEFLNSAEHYGLKFYIEISRNGKYHAHIFFSEWIKCWKIRCIAKRIREETGLDFEIFPKQDEVIAGGEGSYGNFINLPLFGKLMEKGRTVFIDMSDSEKPYIDQWGFLTQIEKVDESTLDEIIKLNGLDKDTETIDLSEGERIFKSEQVENVFRNCQAMRDMKEEAKTHHDLSHEKRNILVAILGNLPPHGPERCLQILKECSDYDEIETEKRIKTATQKPWNCKTIIGRGICNGLCQNIVSIGKKSPIAFAYQKLGPLKDIVTSLRKNVELKAFERKKKIADEIVKHLKSNGYFIYTDNHNSYYFLDAEKKLYHFDDTELVALINDMSGINRSESEWKYLAEELKVEAIRRGKKAEIHRFAFYNTNNKSLYISKFDGQMYRLDGNEIKLLSNGSDEILFWDDAKSLPYEYRDKDYKKGLIYKLLVNPINFVKGKEARLSPEEQRLLWEIYLFTLFFESLLPTKVILAIIGPRGGGKTSVLNWLLAFLFGPKFKVISLAKGKEDAFLATITNTCFAAFDNVDGKIEWLNDHLAAIATGAVIKLRKLYTTNEEIEYKPKVFIALSSRTPQFKRDDVVDRLLLLLVDRIKNFKSEKSFLEELLTKRSAVWTETLKELNRIVGILKNDKRPFTGTFRMADWAELAWRIADSRNEGDKLLDILHRMQSEQTSFLLEDNPLYESLVIWLEAKKNKGRVVTARELYSELSVIVTDKMKIKDWWIKSSQSLGQYLKNLKDDLGLFFNIEVIDKSGGINGYRFTLRDETTDTTRNNSETTNVSA